MQLLQAMSDPYARPPRGYNCRYLVALIRPLVDAGLILVLENGRLVAQGTHHQLMESSPGYREIAASQLVLEETL